MLPVGIPGKYRAERNDIFYRFRVGASADAERLSLKAGLLFIYIHQLAYQFAGRIDVKRRLMDLRNDFESRICKRVVEYRHAVLDPAGHRISVIHSEFECVFIALYGPEIQYQFSGNIIFKIWFI